jgi:hypothetical protein
MSARRTSSGPTGNGGAFPSEPSEIITVCYRDDPAITIEVSVIRRWRRGEIDGPAMSASSGPKDYLRNHVFFVFERSPERQSVWMVRGQYLQSAIFLLVVFSDGLVYDMAGREVVAAP